MAWNEAAGGDWGADRPGGGAAGRVLAGFRDELYRCLARRADALFCLADAVLCEDRRVTDLARLSLVPEFGRGHGALYDGLNAGRAVIGRLRTAVAGLPLDAVRIGPDDDETELAAAQLREVVARLAAAGHWKDGDPAVIVAVDAGY